MIHTANEPVTSDVSYPLGNGYDEFCTKSHGIREHWRPFARRFQDMNVADLKRLTAESRRLAREDGITYHVHGDTGRPFRRWTLDVVPLILDQQDWCRIEAGLVQRATLLDLMLADIYGPRRLITDGIVPPELIYSPGGFVRQCDQVRIPGCHQLMLYSADLARGSDGTFWVTRDRTQATAGFAYVLENRNIMSRLLPDLLRESGVRPLTNFYNSLRQKLDRISPRPGMGSRIAVLTPGQHDPAYFESAYLATHLGYTMVQGGDLTVRDGKVWLKSIDGLRLVDIILRRVADRLCDPLELRPESQLGVAGLLEASRLNNVTIVNPLGSCVLENPGLMAFLPSICRYFLNEDLQLPSAATWWCGQPKERDYVLANLDKLVIKPAYRRPGLRTVVGSAAGPKERQTLREDILARPYLYVAQEKIALSTTPTLVNQRLQPRHSILRTFLLADDDGYEALPGGLARSASTADEVVIAYDNGGLTRDTWVLGIEQDDTVHLRLPPTEVGDNVAYEHVPASRAAANLFWVGRLAERAETTARLLRVVRERSNAVVGDEDAPANDFLKILLKPLSPPPPDGTADADAGDSGAAIESEIRSCISDPNRDDSLVAVLSGFIDAAYAVRDRWSMDSWRILNNLKVFSEAMATSADDPADTVPFELDRLISELVAFTGLNMENTTRDLGWTMLDIGRRIERGMALIRLIKTTLVPTYDSHTEYMVFESVLAATESLITYRRRCRSHLALQPILELLLLDETNPRSLVYQFMRLSDHTGKLPRPRRSYRLDADERLIMRALTKLRLVNPPVLTRTDDELRYHDRLNTAMKQLLTLLERNADAINRRYFLHVAEARQLVPVTMDLDQ